MKVRPLQYLEQPGNKIICSDHDCSYVNRKGQSVEFLGCSLQNTIHYMLGQIAKNTYGLIHSSTVRCEKLMNAAIRN